MSISLTHAKHGPADGYLADFSGRLARVDEPISGVDAAVFQPNPPSRSAMKPSTETLIE